MSVDQILKALQTGDIVLVLGLFIITGFLGKWVYGPVYQRMVDDRDEWKTIAVSATATCKTQAEQLASLTEVTERLTQQLGRGGRR